MIETKRLQFRPYQWTDLDFLASLWANPDVVRYIGNGKTKNIEEIRALFPAWVKRSQSGFGLQVAVLKESGEPIGHAGLIRQEVDGKHEWEIGYWLAKKYWGQGFATEAALGFRDHAVQQLGISRVISIIQPANHASIHVAQKIGMVKEKETIFRSVPVLIYSLETSSKTSTQSRP
ncbi:GNAT family N-acetyltransferase [Lihuaxuella thermophila]|uniref:Protein N-acetyltransferase, RimJ/RimL family n=1 Tax=Lihuaxuella thermophila TaxID=1173111 RepID=A0A1H8FVR9_9BACL|nr:GNAT family N-acetyltransferase [Lihuaxuella thermophila]SEN35645.1 Protein N-acetyltransferase, RimJ/RimL family [Lihuaxuella thermophila]